MNQAMFEGKSTSLSPERNSELEREEAEEAERLAAEEAQAIEIEEYERAQEEKKWKRRAKSAKRGILRAKAGMKQSEKNRIDRINNLH